MTCSPQHLGNERRSGRARRNEDTTQSWGETDKTRPYKLNPIYKQKVKAEIDRMLEAGIIEPIEESKWIILMVVWEKKQGGIRICVDLRKLNEACLHDPFPTPFTDEVLENVGGQEVYSFTDRFFRIPLDQDSTGRQIQDHFFYRMGILPVHGHAVRTKECTNNIFQSSCSCI